MAADLQDIHQKAVKWIVEEMERAEHHQCVKIELFFTPPDNVRREPIKSWHRHSDADRPFFEEYKKAVYPDRLAQEIIELAEHHAESYGVTQAYRFKLVSFHALGGGRHTFPFTIAPEASASGGDTAEIGSADLDPTQRGQVAQLMRHLENQQRMNKDMMMSFVGTMRDVTSQLRDENQALREQLAGKDRERREWLDQIEAARSKDHERQIEAQMVVADTDRKAFASKRIFGLLPVVVSKVLESKHDDDAGAKPKLDKDGKPKKWKPSPLAIALGELADSLTDEQQEIIENALQIEQKIMLGEAIRLSKKGGSVMLPQIVSDLAQSLEREQLGVILKHLSPEQQKMFVRATSLAKAEAEPAADAEKSAGTNGTSDAPNHGVA